MSALMLTLALILSGSVTSPREAPPTLPHLRLMGLGIPGETVELHYWARPSERFVLFFSPALVHDEHGAYLGFPRWPIAFGRSPLTGHTVLPLTLPEDASLAPSLIHLQGWSGGSYSNVDSKFGAPKTLHEATPEIFARFGFSIESGDFDADGNDELLIGAPMATDHAKSFHGEAFVYSGSELDQTTKLPADAISTNAWFGSSTATGDIDGDGFDDAIVGAILAEKYGYPEAGALWAYFGPDFARVKEITSPSPEPYAHFGGPAATGDVNGDGFDDVAFGAPMSDIGDRADAGMAYVALGPNLSVVVPLTEPDPEAGALFGTAVDVGDLNGDGFDDVVVTAITATSGDVPEAGEAFVFYGPTLTRSRIINDPEPASVDRYGRDCTIGDFNGDGISDLAVSSYRANVGPFREAGEVWVFAGPHLLELAYLTAPLPEDVGEFGVALAAGDLNEDGRDELAVGVEFLDLLGGHQKAGGVFLFEGGSPPFRTPARRLTETSPQYGSVFGFSLTFGRWTGTGLGFAASALSADVGGQIDAGRVTVFD